MNNKGTNTPYLVLALLVIVGVTLVVFGLAENGYTGYSDRVLANLFAIILAEFITFGYLFYCVATRDSDRSRQTFPFEFAGLVMLLLYDVSVAIVALLALSPISDAWLMSLHLIVLLGITLGMILMVMGSKHIASQEVVECENRVAFFLLADEAKSIAELSRRLDHESWVETCVKLNELCEEFDYVSGDSLSGGEQADEKVVLHLKNLHLLLQTCPVVATEEWVIQADVAIKAVGVSVRNRELVMQRLRNRALAKAR